MSKHVNMLSFNVQGGAVEWKQGGEGERSCYLMRLMLNAEKLQPPALTRHKKNKLTEKLQNRVDFYDECTHSAM